MYIKKTYSTLKLMSGFSKSDAFLPSPLPVSSGRQPTSCSFAPYLQNTLQHIQRNTSWYTASDLILMLSIVSYILAFKNMGSNTE